MFVVLDSVRLIGGPGRCSGSLEVLVNHTWSSVCAEDFDLTKAEMLCRELDCGGVSEFQGVLLTDGPVVGRSIHCNGTETALTTVSALRHDVTLWLDGLHCSGYLMLKYEDQWRHVNTVDQDMDLDFGSALCQQLGCGLALPNMNIKDVTLYIGPGEPNSHLILRAVIHHVLIISAALCIYCWNTALLWVPLPAVITPTISDGPTCDSGEDGPGTYFTYKCTAAVCIKEDAIKM
ncbi:hypothetical protein WMY93_017004 [Mugilogobius chulae]|uniref:SRCR domain-containing protein n=1 Tax=Mugilogobius chulae TaxID=88201 RepID=A0AAW0NY04_9GOBI